MAQKDPHNFPVKMTKGTGKDKVTKHAYSIISYRQLETQGFKLDGKASAQGQTEPNRPPQDGQKK